MTEMADMGCDADADRRASDGKGLSRESSTNVPANAGRNARQCSILRGGTDMNGASVYLR